MEICPLQLEILVTSVFSQVPDTSTSPELEAKPRRRIRKRERKREEMMAKHNMEEATRDTADAGVEVQDQDESSLYIDVDLPPEAASSAPTSSRAPTEAQASLLERPPQSRFHPSAQRTSTWKEAGIF